MGRKTAEKVSRENRTWDCLWWPTRHITPSNRVGNQGSVMILKGQNLLGLRTKARANYIPFHDEPDPLEFSNGSADGCGGQVICTGVQRVSQPFGLAEGARRV